MSTVLAAVCQLPSILDLRDPAWLDLCEQLAHLRPDLLVLNEMPWGPWLAGHPSVDEEAYDAAMGLSEHGLRALTDCAPSTVLGSRPVRHGGRRLNEGFVWNRRTGYHAVHSKQYFPEEPGFHESRWFQRGDTHFRIHEVDGVRIGFLLCTELMFNEHARHYGRERAHLIAVPRATEKASLPRWRVAMQMAGMVSGCWVLSSNRSEHDAGVDWAGGGLVIDPTGACVAETSAAVPLITCRIDTEAATHQQARYPCYVPELD
jgi:N-carbamoylputrescine amidase